MTDPVRIAFVGRTKSGKSYCGEYLRVYYNFKVKNFDDGVKRLLRNVYPYEKYHQIRWETKRTFYETLYKLDPDIWLSNFRKRMVNSTANIVCTDARYVNEVEGLRELGFIIIRVTRPPSKHTNLTKALGKTYAPGTLLLLEEYSKDFTKEIQVDFSIHNVPDRVGQRPPGLAANRNSTKAALDEIMKKLGVEKRQISFEI